MKTTSRKGGNSSKRGKTQEIRIKWENDIQAKHVDTRYMYCQNNKEDNGTVHQQHALTCIGKTGYSVLTCKKGKPDTLMKWLKRYESRIIVNMCIIHVNINSLLNILGIKILFINYSLLL